MILFTCFKTLQCNFVIYDLLVKHNFKLKNLYNKSKVRHRIFFGPFQLICINKKMKINSSEYMLIMKKIIFWKFRIWELINDDFETYLIILRFFIPSYAWNS